MARKTKKAAKPRGRPSRFTKEVQRQLLFCAEKGWTDVESAKMLGIDQSTLTKWKQRHQNFFTSLKEAKAIADRKVERSLFERACGFSHPDTKAQWVQDEKGGRWEYAELVKHYPPDTTACIFWLKNRQPAQWRDKVEQENTGELKLRIVYDEGTPNADA